MPFMGTNRFGGILPARDTSELPAEAAQTALNVDLTGGNLKPIDVSNPFYALHSGSVMVDQIPSGEVISISTPNKPTVTARRMLQALGLNIYAYVWISYLDPNTGAWVSVKKTVSGEIIDTQYTEYGMKISFGVLPVSFVQNAGILYDVKGPLFQFAFAATDDGPDSTLSYPADDSLSPENSQFPPCLHPYSDENGVIFGHFQVVRCDYPTSGEEYYDNESHGVTRIIPPSNTQTIATFYIDMNYVVNSRRYFYYCSTFYDANGREGPPSDISDVAIIKPGEYALVNVSTSVINERLYRSVDGQAFVAVAGGDDVDSPYLDTFLDALGDALPLYGNPVSFEKGNLLHPAQFGIGFKDEYLYFSDVYRLHAWPDEWKVKFEYDIMAVQLIGSSVVVFTEGPSGNDGKVYMLTGSDPRYMGRYEVITTEPLLSKLSLCKIGQSLFYVSNDGVVSVSSGGPQIITKNHYTRRQWLALTPNLYAAKVADNSIFLTHSGSSANLRIDLDEGVASVSTWTATSAVAGTWKSRQHEFPVPVRFTTARILSTVYPVSLTLHGVDTGATQVVSITSSLSQRLPRMVKCRRWAYTVSVPLASEISHVAIATATGELAQV